MSASAVTKTSAASRTLSLFTNRTDLEDANARDGSDPDPISVYSELRRRPKYAWKRFELTRYTCDAINAMIHVVNEFPETKSGRWFYRAFKDGTCIGVFTNISDAADVLERWEWHRAERSRLTGQIIRLEEQGRDCEADVLAAELQIHVDELDALRTADES